MNKLIVLCLVIMKITSPSAIDTLTEVPKTKKILQEFLKKNLSSGKFLHFSIDSGNIYALYEWDEDENECTFSYKLEDNNSLSDFKFQFSECKREIKKKNDGLII